MFRRSIYQTLSQVSPHRAGGARYIFTYLVAPVRGRPGTIAGQPNDSGHNAPMLVDSLDPRAADGAY
jgi:hypothetical protein